MTTMFAKRHYETIAQVMQSTAPSPNTQAEAMRQWEIMRDELADTFSGDNGMFKRDRFIRACEPGANVRARS